MYYRSIILVNNGPTTFMQCQVLQNAVPPSLWLPETTKQNKLKICVSELVIPAVDLSASLVTCRASFYHGKCFLLTILQHYSCCPRSCHCCSKTQSEHLWCQADAAVTDHAGETVQAHRAASYQTVQAQHDGNWHDVHILKSGCLV